MNIIGIKLQNGDEIISRYEQDDPKINMTVSDFIAPKQTSNGDNVPLKDVILLIQPFLLHLQQTQKGVTLALSPWLLSSKDPSVSLNVKQHALCIFTPDDAVQKAYLEQTTNITLLG